MICCQTAAPRCPSQVATLHCCGLCSSFLQDDSWLCGHGPWPTGQQVRGLVTNSRACDYSVCRPTGSRLGLLVFLERRHRGVLCHNSAVSKCQLLLAAAAGVTRDPIGTSPCSSGGQALGHQGGRSSLRSASTPGCCTTVQSWQGRCSGLAQDSPETTQRQAQGRQLRPHSLLLRPPH